RAVDVGIKQACPGALLLQGQGQIDCRGRLAYTALAGSDHHDIADAAQVRARIALYRGAAHGFLLPTGWKTCTSGFMNEKGGPEAPFCSVVALRLFPGSAQVAQAVVPDFIPGCRRSSRRRAQTRG